MFSFPIIERLLYILLNGLIDFFSFPDYTDHFDDRASYTSDVSRQSEPVHRYSSKGFSTKAANKNAKRSKSVPRSTNQTSAAHNSSKSLPRSASASRNNSRARQQSNLRSVHDEEHTEEELAYINNSSTLPAHSRRRLMVDGDDLPPASSTPVEPLSEAIVEEERQNSDGESCCYVVIAFEN